MISITVALLFALSAGGGWWTWRWYQHRPKPHLVSVTIDSIPITKLEKELHFPALNVVFDGSVARLEQIQKGVTSGVHLEPATEG